MSGSRPARRSSSAPPVRSCQLSLSLARASAARWPLIRGSQNRVAATLQRTFYCSGDPARVICAICGHRNSRTSRRGVPGAVAMSTAAGFDTCMKSLAVRLLGEFAVDGVEAQALGSRKARLALHLLALADGQPVPGDVLADALWADAPPAKPEDQLAVLMSRLRGVLGRDRISRRSGGYVLHADWQDDTELSQLTAETERRRRAGNVVGAAAAARVGLSLLRGAGPAPLPGEWAQLRRAALDRLIGRARLTAAAALLEAGDWMAAADAAAAALEQDPYEEAALRTLMRAYVAGGQAATALAVYAKARERLADDLGTDPSPETVQLHAALLAGDLAATVPSPAAGKPGDGLVGRAGELAYLDAAAARPAGDTAVVVVDGEPGIGKTALLRAWAGRRAAAGDTVLVASCGQLDRSLPLDALLTTLAGLVRRLAPEEAARLLGQQDALLHPMLGGAAR